jgi:hypothetical protein
LGSDEGVTTKPGRGYRNECNGFIFRVVELEKKSIQKNISSAAVSQAIFFDSAMMLMLGSRFQDNKETLTI